MLGALISTQVIDSKVNVNTLAEIPLQNLPDRVRILRAFTKGAIQNDEWVKILNRIRELKEARTTLENEKDDLATELTEVLTENVSETISSHAESQAKEMIDKLIQDIEGEIVEGGVERLDDGNDSISGMTSREDISGSDNGVVAIFPTKRSGVDFLKENNAWGFVRIGRDPQYVVM